VSKLLDFYKSILNVGSMIADENGIISAAVGNATTPQNVGNKRLVLPTREHMGKLDKSDIIMFNPMQENIMRGESEVMAKFRSNANLKLNLSLQTILGHLLVIASSTGLHDKLSGDHFELISLLKDVDEKTIDAYKSLIKAMPLGNIEKCFVHIYIKKSAMINGKSHRRGAIVVFPLYEELCKNETGAYGVKMRKRDHAAFKAVLERLFPGIATPNQFSRGSINDTAPSLDALLHAVMGIASGINAIVDDYCEVMPELKDLRYDDEWVSQLNDLEQFALDLRLTPPQEGNEGALVEKAAPTPPPIANVAPPVYRPAQTAPGYPAGYGAPAPYQHQEVGPVVNETGKVDFNESIRRIPQLAAMAGGSGAYGYTPALPPGPMSNRMGTPAFARATQYPAYGGYPNNPGMGNGYPNAYGGGYGGGSLGGGI
jgi:hypothetical protein